MQIFNLITVYQEWNEQIIIWKNANFYRKKSNSIFLELILIEYKNN